MWSARWAKVSPTVSMSSGSDSADAPNAAAPPAIYFDGATNRRHWVALTLGAVLEISENGVALASWRFDDLRIADGGRGTLRLKCTVGLPLARLEVSDPAVQAEIRARAAFLGAD